MIYARQMPVLLLLLAAVVSGALSQEVKKEADSAPTQEVQNIINETYSFDAEYAIDILLKIVRSDKLPDVKWQKRLLNESFRRLEEVQRPNRRRLVLKGISVENRQVLLSEAFERRLDALSFRSEILKQMLRADPKEARRLAFDTGFTPMAKTLLCDDALSDEFEPFYEVIAEIAKTAFSPAEIKGQKRLIALLPFIESIATISQIAPVGKMIISLDTGKVELNHLLLAYGSAIKAMRPSDREFSGFLWSYDWIRQFMSVLKVCEGKDIQCANLKDNLGQFIVRNFKNDRCVDNGGTYREYGPGLIKYLNSALFIGAPLKAEDLKPSSIAGPAKLDSYGESAGARRIIEKYRVLNRADTRGGERELSDAEKVTPEWIEKYEDLFGEIESWDGEGEKNPVTFFHQKCNFYAMLYELAPAGGLQAKALRALNNFLIGDPAKKESRIEWFFWVENFIKMIGRNADLKFELLDNSKDPVIRLYSVLK